MGTIELLRQAYVAGLDVRAVGGKLCVSGLKRYEPLALELLDHKSELMPILQAVAIYGPHREEPPQLTPGDLPAELAARMGRKGGSSGIRRRASP